mmetsp:Transcript_18247/g.54071  ORF Transcript_18247/g.54071 Transcript_18247/m.54071 type:complete len:560 (-) Transcript_18247:993-2672(-)
MSQLDVLVSILIIGAPKKWPSGTMISRGSHNMYHPGTRPLWLENGILYNRDHCSRFNHSLEIEEMAGPDFWPWQLERCNALPPDTPSSGARRNCFMGAHRENCTWYKLRWLLQHLLARTAEYVLFIDCDAIILTRPGRDTVAEMVATMNADNIDLMVADEDWQMKPSTVGATNTGVILVRNTAWSRYFLSNIVGLQENRTCGSNEQTCFRALLGRGWGGAKEHIKVYSGFVWNRHPTRPKEDWDVAPDARIVHFMGAAKPAMRFVNIPQDGACHGRLCLNVDQCAKQLEERRDRGNNHKYALAIIHDLHRPEGDRFRDVSVMRSVLNAAKRAGADAVLVVPADSIAAHPLTVAEHSTLQEHGYKIRKVDWLVPPALHPTMPNVDTCARKKYLLLHILGLEGYNAVMAVDGNMKVVGDPVAALKCASQNKVLGTAAMTAPLNGAFLAVAPSKQLQAAATHFLAGSTLLNGSSWASGADGGRFPPSHCAAGLLWALFYEPEYTDAAHAAFAKAGVQTPPSAHQLDRCRWGRYKKTDPGCNPRCDGVQLAHPSAECDNGHSG